ncbi:MAG: cupin domain-containing protein [Acidimicrobiia bacterium]
MAKIRIVDAVDPPWVTKVVITPQQRDGASHDPYEIQMRVHHEGDNELPRLHEIEHPPGKETIPHAHDADEIIYVVAGDLVIGNRSLPAGSSVFVPANTLYAFRAGPQGLRFVNFRPRGNVGTVTKDEFMDRRAAARP